MSESSKRPTSLYCAVFVLLTMNCAWNVFHHNVLFYNTQQLCSSIRQENKPTAALCSICVQSMQLIPAPMSVITVTTKILVAVMAITCRALKLVWCIRWTCSACENIHWKHQYYYFLRFTNFIELNTFVTNARFICCTRLPHIWHCVYINNKHESFWYFSRYAWRWIFGPKHVGR